MSKEKKQRIKEQQKNYCEAKKQMQTRQQRHIFKIAIAKMFILLLIFKYKIVF